MRLLRTLRGRLVLVLGGALLAGLVLMGAASVALLHHSLISRTDQRLIEMSRPWKAGIRPPPPPDNGRPTRLPTDFRVLFFDAAGNQTGMVGQSTGNSIGPVLPDPRQTPRVRTVPGSSGDTEWRVRTTELPNGETIAVALSLSDVQATVNQLVTIELVAGGIVLVGLAVVATVTVRMSLRPLTRIEQTADAIADGELDRRIPDRDPRTETGRLGSALNTMLERLVEALQQRERSEQRLRRFVADASHELRTPLTSIRGFAELSRLRQPLREHDARTMMGRIESEASRMSELVEDLLLLARMDHQRTIDLADLDLVPLVREIVHDGQARDPDREITLHTDRSQLRALGDGPRLRQVVNNLVNNALTHTTPASPLTVTLGHGSIGTDAVASAGAEMLPASPTAVVTIADQGPGIPMHHARRIFDRFYRIDDDRSSGGTGLGLAIVAAIAEAHNGRIELHANDHGGSTFRLLLHLT